MANLDNCILDFINRIDPSRKQAFIAGQNPNLSTYKDWYKGKTSWHTRKTHENGEIVVTTIEASGTPKLIAEDWASNYANENTLITVSSKNKKENVANEKINEILQKNKFFGRFNQFSEKFNALGCGATVVIPNKFSFDKNNKLIKDANKKIKIYFLDANRVVPISVDDNEITESAFIRVTTNETILQVHILVDDKYVIGEVRGKNEKQNEFATKFDYEKAVIINTGSSVPLFQIWYPNIASSDEICESIYSQAIGWFKLVDTIFDCWYKEFKRGAKKRFISTELREIGADGKPIDVKDFLEDEDIMVPLGADGKSFINEFNAELRVEPIIKSLVSAMNVAARLCGLGDSSFEIGENGGRPIQTATAAILKESKLYKNIIKQENLATAKIKGLLLAIKEVYNTYISDDKLEFEEDDIQVVYDDNIMEDTQQKKDNQLKEVTAGIMSIAEYRANWYDEDEESALKFVQENGLLLDKYTLPLQSHVITPEMFVELVFGKDYKHKNELIAYIEKNQAPVQTDNTPFADESNDEENEDEDDE